MLSISRIALLLTIPLSLPAFADSLFQASCDGFQGIDARPGYGPIGSAPDGHKGFGPGGRGGDGQRGRDGGNASPASAGRSACSMQLLVERDPADATKLKISGRVGAQEVNERIDYNQDTKILLSACGGRGGDGADGGAGQDGGRGGDGADAAQGAFRAGDGGRGGDGGSAGSSASGADGGNGGNIVVQVRADQQELAKLVEAHVASGRGGNRPLGYARAGRGGDGGRAGNNCYFSPEGYKCVGSGFQGSRGIDGRPAFGSATGGRPGIPGTYAVELAQ